LTLLKDDNRLSIKIIFILKECTTWKLLTTSGTDTGLGRTSNAPILIGDIPASNGVANVVGKILFSK
jgi:hypothetical protein